MDTHEIVVHEVDRHHVAWFFAFDGSITKWFAGKEGPEIGNLVRGLRPRKALRQRRRPPAFGQRDCRAAALLQPGGTTTS
jgi:hypothetical protein